MKMKKQRKNQRKKIIKKDEKGKESDSEEQEEKEEIQKAKSKKKYFKISIYLSVEEFNKKKTGFICIFTRFKEITWWWNWKKFSFYW